jgi:hypothetical protein
MEELVSSLNCPVCLEVPKTKPIYQCGNGHLICCHCKPNLAIPFCPTCVMEYTDPPIRCIMAEKIWDMAVTGKCKFEGCNFTATNEELPDHEVKCFYETIKCPKCQTDVPMLEISQHIRIHDPYKNQYNFVHNLHRRVPSIILFIEFCLILLMTLGISSKIGVLKVGPISPPQKGSQIRK